MSQLGTLNTVLAWAGSKDQRLAINVGPAPVKINFNPRRLERQDFTRTRRNARPLQLKTMQARRYGEEANAYGDADDMNKNAKASTKGPQSMSGQSRRALRHVVTGSSSSNTSTLYQPERTLPKSSLGKMHDAYDDPHGNQLESTTGRVQTSVPTATPALLT